METKYIRRIALLLVLLNAAGALSGGYGFLKDPSGQGNGISTDWLLHSPFDDYFYPGLILFTVNGLFGVWTGWQIGRQNRNYPVYVLLQSILLGGWVVVQVWMLRTMNFLQILFLAMAAVLLICGWVLKKRSGGDWKKDGRKKINSGADRVTLKVTFNN